MLENVFNKTTALVYAWDRRKTRHRRPKTNQPYKQPLINQPTNQPIY